MCKNGKDPISEKKMAKFTSNYPNNNLFYARSKCNYRLSLGGILRM